MRMRLFIDTNVIVDALEKREPFAEKARLILALGEVGEFELWISPSQVTDIYYVLSHGEKKNRKAWATEALMELRAFINICSLTEEDIDIALASSWDDFEDACINQALHKVKPDALITGNVQDYQLSDFPVFDCNVFFEWLEEKHQLVYSA